MILVDTSVWIDHLRVGNARLSQMLNTGQVLTHPYVVGELALGSLKNRQTVLNALQDLPKTPVATDDEMLHFIETNALFGLGIGYIDVHLLVAVRMSPGALLWTRDKRLFAASDRLGLALSYSH
jgi:predicted nucleic acid-binding protein